MSSFVGDFLYINLIKDETCQLCQSDWYGGGRLSRVTTFGKLQLHFSSSVPVGEHPLIEGRRSYVHYYHTHP